MKQLLKNFGFATVFHSFLIFMPCLLAVSTASAHPGSGIVVDKNGRVYFMDTGKGVWTIDTKGRLTYLPSSRFHWMAIDEAGQFSNAPKNFGSFFERVTEPGARPIIIICPEFPFTIGTDGNIYYADTRHTPGKIVRRTPEGKETVIASDKTFAAIQGIATGRDGSLYITEASNPRSNSIRRISLNGTHTMIASYTGKINSNIPLETTASYCRGLALDSNNNIYVAATGSRCVLKITPHGIVKTILQTTGPWTPTAVTIYKGEIYVQEWHDVSADKLEVREAWIPRVRKIARDGKVTTLVTVSR